MNVDFEAQRAASKAVIVEVVSSDQDARRELLRFGKQIFEDSCFVLSLEREFLARERLRRERSRLQEWMACEVAE